MKKIMIIALALIGSACYSADAQTKTKREACKAPEGKVCTKKGCYKTPFAYNFKICKSELGYYVCCEEPNLTNSTFPALPVAKTTTPYSEDYDQTYAAQTAQEDDRDMNEDMSVPQSQSYPRYSANTATTYEGYYGSTRKSKIKVCNNTDNIAEANRAPYKGCPSPAYDGQQKNMTRNVNVSNPSSSFPVPPNSGNKQ